MRDYSFWGDVSVPGQNRIRDVYMGCGGAPCAPKVAGLRGAIPSGQYMGAIGKVVSMRGLGATYLGPTMRAQSELAQMSVPRAPSTIAVMGLGSTRDRAMCQASFAAGQAGTSVASGYHQQSGGGDQGWTTALGISSALMTVGGAMCNLIDTGEPTNAAGQPLAPQQPQVPPAQQGPDWMLIGGVALGAVVVGALLFGK